MNSVPYIFDINKITEFVFGNPNDKTNEVEITEHYIYDKESKSMMPNTREVKEVKVDMSASFGKEKKDEDLYLRNGLGRGL